MRLFQFPMLAALAIAVIHTSLASAQVAGKPGAADLVVANGGRSEAVVVVSPMAGPWEKRAAADLAKYIGKISGATPKVADTAEAVAAAMKAATPVLIVGEAALAANPALKSSLSKVAKPNPLLRADAVVVKRDANRVYLAGTNDDSHYYAVATLLRMWGCRWFVPTQFGECIPSHPKLSVGDLDYAYGSPFEVRRYWLAWNGDTTGKEEFAKRNFFNEVLVPNGHSLAQYTKELIPPGKTMFNVPISEDRTAKHVADKVLPQFKKGEDVMLGLEDGIYESESAEDKKLIALQYDKYFLTQSYTDAFMVFYNKVADQLVKAAPDSKSRIGFLIYSNITLPPVRDVVAAKPLVGYLAPIDFDPIHGMDDPKSGPRREYRAVMEKWAKVMQGRLVIYDYDQSMLVWRDLPNPSHQAFRHDVKHYLKAGILGVDTESRGATATLLTNLYMRGQLLWNPSEDADALLADFYQRFYGPVAKPMADYWNAIFKAWEETLVTEHEYFVAPAIYTPELLAKLGRSLHDAEAINTADKAVSDRIRFTRLGYEVLTEYMAMVKAAAVDVDYKAAVAAGERGLAAREKLTQMNGTFTTYKVIGEHGYAWWPGEVLQYRELLPFTDGTKGTLVAKLPLVWNFRRDPKNIGVKEGWAKQTPELKAWEALPKPVSVENRTKNAGNWEQLRADVYAQAQGVVTDDFQSYTGHAWYQTEIELNAEQVGGKVRLRFPGLFNECRLFVNGEQVGHRPFKGVWWMNDYRFEWDVDVAGKLKAGKNSVVVQINNPHHLGGMFRRPFVYRAASMK
jgi:hypothetical protein